ncbi:MAG: hypothetical protein JWN73_396 [Betaproteobacteria bacterium]|nr:hypothetical protein [Betaproteobacteria bacterium]
MLTSIKKLIAGDGAKPQEAAALEYIFLFDLDRKKEYLLDLRAILRTPGSRRALPRLHKLETIVTRNEHRIRIPHEAMPELVRELVSVERRVPEQSPLRELMNAVPGLAASIRVDPTPTSVLMGKHEEVPGELNTREMNTATKRIGEALAQQQPASSTALPAAQAKPAAQAPTKAAAAPAAKPADQPQAKPAGAAAQGKPASATAAKPGPAAANKPAQKPAPAAPAKAAAPEPKKPTETSFGDTTMSSSEQQRFLQDSSAQFEAEVLRTGDLADSDLAGYLDLCLMSGENEKVMDTLLPRVGETPSAWAWVRLLKAAEAAKKLEFEVWCSNFHSWIKRDHPALLPDKKAGQESAQEDLLFGVRRAGLQALEQQELKP